MAGELSECPSIFHKFGLRKFCARTLFSHALMAWLLNAIGGCRFWDPLFGGWGLSWLGAKFRVGGHSIQSPCLRNNTRFPPPSRFGVREITSAAASLLASLVTVQVYFFLLRIDRSVGISLRLRGHFLLPRHHTCLDTSVAASGLGLGTIPSVVLGVSRDRQVTVGRGGVFGPRRRSPIFSIVDRS